MSWPELGLVPERETREREGGVMVFRVSLAARSTTLEGDGVHLDTGERGELDSDLFPPIGGGRRRLPPSGSRLSA
jgi:hypothetical protein